MLQNITSANLFSSAPVIHFTPERSTCSRCHTKLKVQKTRAGKRAAALAIGDFIAHETVYYCPECRKVFHSTELRTLIPEHCDFGYDIIVFIGESLFLQCRNYQEIRRELLKRNVVISESEIAFEAKKFVLYLGLLHKAVRRKTKKYMKMNGGYIFHLDGTCDGGSPHLISALDGITEIVLDNKKLLSENAEDLIPFLKSTKKAYGVPLAVVSDMGKGIAVAVKEVFNRLRKAMRIALPGNKRGLNDVGEQSCNMKTIEKEVGKFRAWLIKSKGYSEHKEYQKLVEQIDKYSEQLFADPIVVRTPAGKALIQPQRTNNILERFFRKLMRGYRKKNGFNSVERILKTMLPETPLAMNLKNKEYMQILLAGKESLEERFAEIDAQQVRLGLENSKSEMDMMYPELKKIIRMPDLPKSIVALLDQAAS